MKVFITGIAGFVGSYLAEAYLSEGSEVQGLAHPGDDQSFLRPIREKVRIHLADIRDAQAVLAVVDKALPDRIFHLAALSPVAFSWKSPQDTFSTNVLGQANLFEAVRLVGTKPRIHVAGSSEEYGVVSEKEVPIREDHPLRPVSPYAVSKVAQDLMGYQYFRSFGMPIIRSRAFNHTGPRRGENFVLSNFCKQIALIEAGMNDPVLFVGNLDAIRDFMDVRDVVRAYHLLLEKGEPGEVYNICSGRGYRLRDLVRLITERSSVKIDIKKDPSRMRPSDLPIVIGNCDKFRARTGWAPQIPIEKTLDDLLNYWRDQTAKRQGVSTSA